MSTPTPNPAPAPTAPAPAAPAAPAAGAAPAPGNPATPSAPAGTGADATAAAEQMLANAIAAARGQQQPDAGANQPAAPAGQETPSPGDEPTPADLQAEVAKWKAMSRKHEAGQLSALGLKSREELEELRNAAAKYQELQDAQKTELQRLTEQATTASQQLAEQRAVNARLMAAATHSIPPDLIDLLGTGTDEEINARAAVLAERLKAAAPPAAAAPAVPAPQRPVESLTPGAAPASAAPEDPDAWIRRATGRTT